MLKVVSAERAWEIICHNAQELSSAKEYVSLYDSLGRVVSEDICAGENLPAFNRSTVDGYAVLASDTYGSSESIPAMLKVKGEVLMGEEAQTEIASGECVKISTGGMLPEGADSALMVEYTQTTSDGFVLCFGASAKWANVNRIGDDVKEGELVISKGTLLSSKHIGVLASLGVYEVPVYQRLKVGIISSGDEIIPIDAEPKIGQIRDVNTHILSALMREQGCEVIEYGIIRDEEKSFCEFLDRVSSECDIVLISGGSSAGTRDMTVKAVDSLGEVLFHGIALKPGKPTIFGKVKGKAVFGLPGHPAAAYTVAKSFAVPLCERLYGVTKKERRLTARLKGNISSNHGRQEFVYVRVKDEIAEPIFRKSGVISLLSQADGYIIIDRNREGLCDGETVEVHLF